MGFFSSSMQYEYYHSSSMLPNKNNDTDNRPQYAKEIQQKLAKIQRLHEDNRKFATKVVYQLKKLVQPNWQQKCHVRLERFKFSQEYTEKKPLKQQTTDKSVVVNRHFTFQRVKISPANLSIDVTSSSLTLVEIHRHVHNSN